MSAVWELQPGCISHKVHISLCMVFVWWQQQQLTLYSTTSFKYVLKLPTFDPCCLVQWLLAVMVMLYLFFVSCRLIHTHTASKKRGGCALRTKTESLQTWLDLPINTVSPCHSSAQRRPCKALGSLLSPADRPTRTCAHRSISVKKADTKRQRE